MRTKGTKIRSRGTDSPLTNPFLSLAVLDTNDAKHRPYCAQIRSKSSRRRILIWFLQTDCRKSRCRAYGLNKQLFAQTAPPPPRGMGRGKGQMRLRLLLERICAQYGFGFFVQEKSKFVSSTASDRKGVVKGESVPLDRVLPTFARTKVGPRRVGVQTRPFQKAPRRRQAR